MESSKIQYTKIAFPEQKPFSAGNIIMICLYHWPMLVLGIIIAVAGVYAYLKYQQPSYAVKATLMIQDVQKTPGSQSALHEIDLSRSPKIMENEIEVLKSNQLIRQVIKDLNLNISYQMRDGFRYLDMYKSSPVQFYIYTQTNNPITLLIRILDANNFLLLDADGSESHFEFGKRFTVHGRAFKLEPTKLVRNYIGQEIKINFSSTETLAQHYQSHINISPVNKLSSAILIALEDKVSARGMDIVNKLIVNYQLSANSEHTKSLNTTLQFLEQRVTSLQVELADAEKTISNFKSSRGLTDLSSDSRVSLENMQANDMRLNEVNVQLSVIAGIERYMKTNSNTEKIPVTIGISDPGLNNLIDKLSQLQLQRERLLATTPETNPDFDPLNRQILITRNAIRENIASTKATLTNTREKLQSYNYKLESAIKKVPVQEQQFITIKRQQAIKENLYNYLLQKKEEVSMNYASTVTKSHIIDNAYVESSKKTSALILYGLAVIAGLAVPAAFVYARKYFTNKVVDIHDINAVLDIPIIAEIAQNNRSASIVLNERNSSETAEQFRALRTRLSRMYGDKKTGRITMVTSSVPGEGKSFLSSNLAVSFAATGRKTLFLELDLRRPQATFMFTLPPEHAGITEVLTGQKGLEEVVQMSSEFPSLHIITSGHSVKNPSELLESTDLNEILIALCDEYDDVIIDSPPTHLVPDALILAPMANVILYSIRQGYTAQSELDYMKDLQQQDQLGTVRLVFNGIQRQRYGYGFRYDNSYAGNAQRRGIYDAVFKDFATRF